MSHGSESIVRHRTSCRDATFVRLADKTPCFWRDGDFSSPSDGNPCAAHTGIIFHRPAVKKILEFRAPGTQNQKSEYLRA